jgi:hypothetical protein
MQPEERSQYAPAERAFQRPEFFATKPTRFTRFLRVFVPYQMWRFVVINVKMIRIIARGH